MSGNNCIYFCEGSCDEVFIKALKEKPELITPGKTKVLNVISTYIPRSVLMTVKPGTNITQGIKLSEQYGELLTKTTQSYTCTRRR